MNKKTIFMLMALAGILAMSMALPAKAADGKISGTFVDENGVPLPQGPGG